MAYCQGQTDWQSENERLASELAAELAEEHPAVVDSINQLRKKGPAEWTPPLFKGCQQFRPSAKG